MTEGEEYEPIRDWSLIHNNYRHLEITLSTAEVESILKACSRRSRNVARRIKYLLEKYQFTLKGEPKRGETVEEKRNFTY